MKIMGGYVKVLETLNGIGVDGSSDGDNDDGLAVGLSTLVGLGVVGKGLMPRVGRTGIPIMLITWSTFLLLG